MDIRIIKVGELNDFVNDPSFAKLVDLPITPLRAISQQHNPNVDLDDPALVIAYNSLKEVIAYFGCLPDVLNNNEKICWSSCWWAHADKGNEAVMPVFYKALQLWNARMLFDALPDRSRSILEKMGYFSFRKIEGQVFYYRSKLHKIIPWRFPAVEGFRGLIRLVDMGLNIPISLVNYFKKSRLSLPASIRISKINEIDNETAQFIFKYSKKDLIQRDPKIFNWIIEYPWLSTDVSFQSRYHFSSFAKHFENILLKIKEGNQTVAFLWLTLRDGTAKLPFCYVEPGKEEITAKALARQLSSIAPEVFICYQQNILSAFQQLTNSVYTKNVSKYFGWTNTLDSEVVSSSYIQDGDGDGVFT